jgi:hypothetical protein
MLGAVFVVHATRKLLSRVGRPAPDAGERSTTVLGDWYATILFWQPQVALFVNESTLLPVLMPLAPAATVTERFPQALSLLLAAHRVSRHFTEAEVAQMADCRLAPTSNPKRRRDHERVHPPRGDLPRLPPRTGPDPARTAARRDALWTPLPQEYQPRPRAGRSHRPASSMKGAAQSPRKPKRQARASRPHPAGYLQRPPTLRRLQPPTSDRRQSSASAAVQRCDRVGTARRPLP